MKRFLLACVLLCLPALVLADQVRVDNVRTSASAERTRVVFDLTGPVEHRIFTLEGPPRVVIDFSGARLQASPELAGTGVIRRMRSAVRDNDDLRVVLDVQRQVQTQSFLMEPTGDYGHRLVVDLESGGGDAPVRTASEHRRQDFIVAIDAGHGGRDPGAIGPSGVMEKTIVLQVARRLERILEDMPGVRPLMIRSSDAYVPLAERRETARGNGADLFLSLHADAVESGGPRGSSVYVLSRTGASSRAASMLAQRENSADLLGDVSLADKDDLTRSVLVDLSRGATLEASVELAADVLDGLDAVGHVHKPSVERAGFVVLKSLDMPSVLVELAFISNAREERLLQQAEYQEKLARAVANGVERYVERYRPTAGRMASGGEYEVQRGDTLSGIARSHQVSVSELRSANDLSSDRITVGSTLRIPD
ncbi:N-acetylmuramoyl-L-alanine amidase [Aquisalimonas lutea]|uniref:N-acetylmuramoyl-L-alanine amidase n=1 Tax=Aquisalimonas lutea TaxID=1327750 RepID=UPI0025B5F0C2|nr:N-acetylmuramoyl-L-alanine amidase [Aquisalimonas lutea]MDN3519295.1 N-acetylmuramoyl-L-alanine amidase [Aquisalimonas lutea]